MADNGESKITKDAVLRAERNLLNDSESFMQPCKGKEDGEPSLKRKFFDPPEKSLPPCAKRYLSDKWERK